MKKIAVGGGKFEIRKVMKVVKQLVKPELGNSHSGNKA